MAEESIRFTLLIGSPIVMLDPENIENNIPKMIKNMIRYGKGLRKELLKLVLKIRNSTSNNSPSKKWIMCFNEF